MIPVFVSFPEANTDLPLPAPSPSVMQDVPENVGWEAVGGITGLQWVGNRATHFHKVTLKFGARDLGLSHAGVLLARGVEEGWKDCGRRK